jgi:hypothetical protein
VIAVMPANEWHLHMDEQSADKLLHATIDSIRSK